MISLLTEYSPWFFVFCLLTGAGYAWLLYNQESPWSKSVNSLLAFIRFLVVTFLCYLLLGPFLRQFRNYYEKPAVVIAIDNSQSVNMVNDTLALRQWLEKVDAMAQRLADNNFEVQINTLSGQVPNNQARSVQFNYPVTNLSQMLSGIQAAYENKNLAGIVLISDGIYNQGSSPAYTPYKTGIYSIGLGDTIPKSDLSLKNVYANKIAYLGNKFPLVAEVGNTSFAGKTTTVTVSQNGRVIASRTIEFTNEQGLQQVEFIVSAQEKGTQHYVVEVNPLNDEFTLLNNTKHVYIDVLDGREKILILATAPHPDVKALRNALEKNDSYQTVVHIPGVSPEDQFKKNEKYDLLIAHQLPSGSAQANTLLKEFQSRNMPILYVVGSQTNIAQFNNTVAMADVIVAGSQSDKVTPSYNSNFNRFTFSEENKSQFMRYPPVNVPFANYRLSGSSEILLYQRVGSIMTEKPLLAVAQENDQRTAVLFGEGVWQWRLQEYVRNDKSIAFDELITKTVQYLVTKEDKRRFRVYTSSSEFQNNEPVQFETEVYNDIYEPVYGQKIDLVLSSDDGKRSEYTYVNSAAGTRYSISGLPQGVYSYRATTELNGKTEVSTGQFSVREIQLEALTTTANFALLRQLAQQTRGAFYMPAELDALEQELIANRSASIIHSTEEVRELLHIHWLFFVLIILVSTEWFIRKFKGAY